MMCCRVTEEFANFVYQDVRMIRLERMGMGGRSAKRKGVVQFVVPGLPVGKSYKQGRGRMFLAPKARKYQEAIAEHAFLTRVQSKWKPSQKVLAILIFDFGTRDKKKIGTLKYTKPDADNLTKSVLDGLQPLIGDDSKVAPRAIRRWREVSRTIIRLRNM